MNRTERMYAMVETLRASGSHGRTAQSLADHFEVSVRTIKRDVHALQAAHVPIVGQDGRGGGYQLARNTTLPPLQFTAAEAAAIAVAIAAEPNIPFVTDARAALHKILAAMTPPQRREVEDVATRIWMRLPTEPIRQKEAHQLDEALRRGVVATIEYADAQGRVSKRQIEPMVFARTGGRWFTLAWCRTRRAGRWFRLDRIRRVHLTREPVVERKMADVFGPPPPDAHPIELMPKRRERNVRTAPRGR